MTDLIKQLQYLSRVTKDYDQEHMTNADYEMIPVEDEDDEEEDPAYIAESVAD